MYPQQTTQHPDANASERERLGGFSGRPSLLHPGAHLLHVAEGLVGLVGDLERRVVPLQVLARRGRLVLAQRCAVHVVGARPVGGPVPDERGDLDQRRLVRHRLGLGDRVAQAVQVVVAVLRSSRGDCKPLCAHIANAAGRALGVIILTVLFLKA